MADLIIIAVVAVIAGLAAGYIRKSVKAGKTCIGCPNNGRCSSRGCGQSCSSCDGKCSLRKN